MKFKVLTVAFIIMGIIFSEVLFAQQSKSDTMMSKAQFESSTHSPKKAAWMSAALPGLGQVYNKKFWKIPIVYAALGTATYFWGDNNNKYLKYKEGYISRIDSDTLNDNLFPGYTADDLRELKNYHWRYRDLNAFIFVGIWALNVLDAVVDAHLYTFDLSNNLSLEVQPNIYRPFAFGNAHSYGLSFSLRF